MSEETLKETNFEDQFRYCILKGDSNLTSNKDSYSLDLLGFEDDIPMLVNGINRPVLEEQVNESLQIQSGSVCLEQDKNSVHDSRLQETSTNVVEKPKISVLRKAPTHIVSSVLQGKRVIIKTNSMSGQKSIIFKQKTGEKVEIPAKLSSVLKSRSRVVKKNKIEPAKPLHPNNVAHVVFPETNVSKSILKSNLIECAESAVMEPDFDVKIEEKDIFAEDEEEIETVIENSAPFDHDYFNLSSNVTVVNEPPPLVKISSKPLPSEEVIENREEHEVKRKVFVKKVNHVVPIKSSNETNQYSEMSFDRFHALQTQRSEDKETNKAETTILEAQLKKPLDKIDVKKPPIGNYEIVNTNVIKKHMAEKDLSTKKNRYIVMIANKKLIKAPLTVSKPKPRLNQIMTSCNKPFRREEVQSIETPPEKPQREFKNVETNTDDSLLEELIVRKMRERSLQNKASKATNTDDLPPVRSALEDRIAFTPSPLSLGYDHVDILDLLDHPLDNGNVSFIPTNGKVIENCGNVLDISYSRGKNISNGWGDQQLPSQKSINGWLNNVGGQNGRPRVEPWKVQLFLDLKNCDQFDSSGNMPLHNAVLQNNVSFVKRQCLALQTRQINVNTLNHNTLTALQLALLHDVNVNIVRLLLQYGSDTSVLDPQGNNVLHMCVTHSSEAVTKLLLGSTVHADINGSNFEGYTPLIMCTLYQKYVQADDLLCTGADPNISDKKSGRTALFHAVEANDVEMVKLLLNHRAMTKVKNFFGTSPHDAMFELDTMDVEIKNLILNKDEAYRSGNVTQPSKGRKRKKGEPGDTYMIKPLGSKFAKIKNGTS